MLNINVESKELFDESNNRFITLPAVSIRMEHSLSSLSKWESEYEKPFLSQLEKHKKTQEELYAYLHMMCLDDVSPSVIQGFNQQEMDVVEKYIGAKKSATWFSEEEKKAPSRTTLTSELIYSYMVGYRIPFETQYWHLNRLITLIRICNEQNKPPKQRKMSKSAAMAQRRNLMAQRRSGYGEY